MFFFEVTAHGERRVAGSSNACYPWVFFLQPSRHLGCKCAPS